MQCCRQKSGTTFEPESYWVQPVAFTCNSALKEMYYVCLTILWNMVKPINLRTIWRAAYHHINSCISYLCYFCIL
jgi:hypothetical protein